MRKLLCLIMFMFCGVASSVSAQEMRSVFLDAPDDIFPMLTKNLRADLVDYADAGMAAKVTNRLDGTTVLEELGADYLKLASTSSSTMQLKLLPVQGDTVVCAVKTVKAEAADSRIYFYDKAWNLMDGSNMFEYPSIRNFFISPEAADECIDKCDIYLLSLQLSAADNTLIAEYTMPQYMSKDDASKVTPLLKKIVYKWNGECFVID